MRIETVYIAEDGKKFYSEEECLEYEAEIRRKEFEDSALLLDENGDKLPLSDKGMTECAYIVCKTDEAAQFMNDEFSHSFGLPWGYKDKIAAGAWMIDNFGEWKDLKKLLDNIETIQRVAKMVY